MAATKDFGPFADLVSQFKQYVTVVNPGVKNPGKGKQPCDCASYINDNYKEWTKKDLTTLATTKYSIDAFDKLFLLVWASIEQEKKDNTSVYTSKALYAQAALAELAPMGKEGVPPLAAGEKARPLSWQEYYGMIQSVYNENKQAITTTRKEGALWRTDATVENLKWHHIIKLNKETLVSLTKDINTLPAFRGLLAVYQYAGEKNSKGEFTEVARYAQTALAKLSPDNTCETLYKMIRDVEFETRSAVRKLEDSQIIVPSKTDKKSIGAIDLSSINLDTVKLTETTPMDQQAALNLLSKRCVVMDNAQTADVSNAYIGSKKPSSMRIA